MYSGEKSNASWLPVSILLSSRSAVASRRCAIPSRPIAPGNPSSMTIRDAFARKFARDLLTDDPDLDVERFLKDCEALSQSR